MGRGIDDIGNRQQMPYRFIDKARNGHTLQTVAVKSGQKSC
jgi:hypothetical protein